MRFIIHICDLKRATESITVSGLNVKLINSSKPLMSPSPITRDKTGVLTVRFISSLVSLKFRSDDEMNRAGVEYTLNVMRTLSLPLSPDEIGSNVDKTSTTEEGMSTLARTLESASSSSEALSRLMFEVLRSSMLLP